MLVEGVHCVSVQASIGLDEAARELARKDADLAEARQRPDFQELLAESP